MAARATLALKAGVWLRRGLLLIVSPVRGYHRRYQAETPLIDLFKFASPALRALAADRRRAGHGSRAHRRARQRNYGLAKNSQPVSSRCPKSMDGEKTANARARIIVWAR